MRALPARGVPYSPYLMRRVALLSTAVLIAGAFFFGYDFSRGQRAATPAAVAISPVVDQVREALVMRYYRDVPARVLRLGSVDAMLSALGDPYTAYLPAADYRLLQREMAGAYVGIGISVLPGRSGLVVASTLLIANTIRLSIFARRREIEVMKLVGATNWFVRGPFMLEGLLCGLVGSAFAVVLLVLGKEIALPLVIRHLDSGSDVHAWPFYRDAVLLLGAGLLLGAAGSGLTLRRFLQV